MSFDPGSVHPGDVLILRGDSLKGRNRVAEHGEEWLVREIDHSVLGRNLGFLICPASYIGTSRLNPEYDRPSSIHQTWGYCRWLRKRGDEHFQIIGVAEERRVDPRRSSMMTGGASRGATQ